MVIHSRAPSTLSLSSLALVAQTMLTRSLARSALSQFHALSAAKGWTENANPSTRHTRTHARTRAHRRPGPVSWPGAIDAQPQKKHAMTPRALVPSIPASRHTLTPPQDTLHTHAHSRALAHTKRNKSPSALSPFLLFPHQHKNAKNQTPRVIRGAKHCLLPASNIPQQARRVCACVWYVCVCECVVCVCMCVVCVCECV